MNMMAALLRSGGLEALARELGVPSPVATAGAEAMLPAVLGGFRKQAETHADGLQGLIGLLEGLGGGQLAAEVMSPDVSNTGAGNTVLGHIFGSKEVSRAVAAGVTGTTGLDPDLLERMLPLLAMLVGGYLAARAKGPGTEADTTLQSVGALIGTDAEDNPLDRIAGTAGKLVN